MISVTKKSNHITKYTQEMSILVSMYGLSFMIKKGDHRKFFEYQIKLINPIFLAEKLKSIIAERPILQENFDRIKLIYHHNLNSLIPEAFFDPSTYKVLLEQNVKLLPNDLTDYNHIPYIEAYNTYVKMASIAAHFSDNTSNLINLHSATVFFGQIEQYQKKSQNAPIFEIFLNIFPNDFQIAVFKHEQLQVFNHFKFENSDEFLYFLFFVLETLEINARQSHIFIFGIEESDDIIQNIKDFTKNLSVAPPKNPSQIYNYF